MEVIFVLFVVGLVVYIAIHNKMVALSVKVEEGYSSIDVALQKRYDLISNLTEVVKGYTKYESELFSSIVRERNLVRKDELLETESRNLFAIAEGYPDLKANTQYQRLMHAMSDCEEHLQAARRFYNSNVSAYNTMIQQFPYSIIANSMGFVAKEFFKFDE